MLCANFGLNRPSGSGKEDENVNSLQGQQQRKDDDSRKMLTAISSGELNTATPQKLAPTNVIDS